MYFNIKVAGSLYCGYMLDDVMQWTPALPVELQELGDAAATLLRHNPRRVFNISYNGQRARLWSTTQPPRGAYGA